jgi:hypothetical protein
MEPLKTLSNVNYVSFFTSSFYPNLLQREKGRQTALIHSVNKSNNMEN